MQFSKRKWGWYLTILSKRYFKIKFLYFKRGGEISLQRHCMRHETWLFLFGQGVMQNYLNKVSQVIAFRKSGDYEYVQRGNWHHFKAIKPTLVLEVQTGICRESDIERA